MTKTPPAPGPTTPVILAPNPAPAGPPGVPSVAAAPKPGDGQAMRTSGLMLKSFADLEGYIAPGKAPVQGQPAQAPKPPAAPAEPVAAEEGDEPAEQPVAKPPEAPVKAPEDKESEIERLSKIKAEPVVDERPNPPPKKLRIAYEESQETIKTLQKELETLRKAPQIPPEVEAVRKELEETKTRYKAIADQIDFSQFVESKEFKETHEKPLRDAIELATQDVVQLTRATDDQPATPQDLQEIVGLDRVRALKRIKELFPEFAEVMFRHYDEIHRANRGMEKAKQGFRESIDARRQKMAAEAKEAEEAATKHFNRYKAEIARDFAPLFAPDEKDPKGNEALAEGYQLAEIFLNGYEGLKPEENARLIASMYHRIGGFDRLVHRLATLEAAKQKEINDLKKQLQAYQDSEPRTGEAGKPAGDATASMTPMERLVAGLK